MIRKLLIVLFASLFTLTIATGCEDSKKEGQQEPVVEEQSKGKCEVEECMSLISTNMTVEEVNEIIGFEGEQKENDIYIWKLTDNTSIEIEYKDNSASIKGIYDKSKMVDNISLSVCYNIINNIKEKTYTYEEMVESFEGVEGHLYLNAPTYKMYMWIKDGKTFLATFSDSNDGKTSIVSLR